MCSEHARSLSFGSSADRVGPVALRPRLTAGLPFRRILRPQRRTGRHAHRRRVFLQIHDPPTHASVRANADTGAARKIRTFQPVDDEPWSNQVMTSTPRVHVHSETPRLCVACHEHGTTLNGFLPVSWDHVVASYGTTRRVAWGGSSARLFDFRVMFVDPTPS